MPPRKQKKPTQRVAKKKPQLGRNAKLALATGAIFLFLLLALIGLSWFQKNRQQPEPVTPSISAPVDSARIEEILTDLEVEVESLLLRSGISLSNIETDIESNKLSFRVHGDYPPEALIQNLIRRLERDPDLKIQLLPQQEEIQISWRGLAGCMVKFVPQRQVEPLAQATQPAPAQKPTVAPSPKRSASRRATGGKIAIIMDDMGRDLKSIRSLLGIDLGVTVAVLPWEENSTQVATLAAAAGREVIIHIPMEPKGYPSVNPGKNALISSLTTEQVRERFRGYISKVPHAVGGNNHMGSRLTEDAPMMTEVATLMKEHGLFFVDSRTTGQSRAFDEMRKVGVAAAGRDVFLDNDENVELIARQIHKLVKLGIRRGQAIGICHPYPETLAALRREADYIRAQGITIVPVSELLVR